MSYLDVAIQVLAPIAFLLMMGLGFWIMRPSRRVVMEEHLWITARELFEAAVGQPTTTESECDPHLIVTRTSYGFRAVCPEHNRRWTILWTEEQWVEERYSPLFDNGRADV